MYLAPAVIWRLDQGWEIHFQDGQLTTWSWRLGSFLCRLSYGGLSVLMTWWQATPRKKGSKRSKWKLTWSWSTSIVWNWKSIKVHLVKAMVFPEVMYRCESWTIKKAEHWRIDAFDLWCYLGCKEIKPVNPKGNQSWIFIGRTDVEAEAPILWPSDMKN